VVAERVAALIAIEERWKDLSGSAADTNSALRCSASESAPDPPRHGVILGQLEVLLTSDD
jgi:hypothetical protein